MIQDFHDVCRKIHAASRLEKIAVFGIQGDIHYLPVASKRKYEAMLRDFPKSFVGVYDERCSLKMLQEDIL